MNKQIITKVLAAAMICVCGATMSACGANEANVYLGISTQAKDNTLLVKNESVSVKQNKEKIEDSKLTFAQNADENYDNLHFCFEGNNIDCVTMTSENKSILYEHYIRTSERVDIFDFYYMMSKDEVATFDFDNDAERFLKDKWDSGGFDDVKNVYFNGVDVYNLTRQRKNKDSLAWWCGGGSNVGYEYNDDETERKMVISTKTATYLDDIIETDEPILEVTMNANSIDLRDDGDSKEVIHQGKSVTSNSDDIENQDFLWRYELLFYNSQQKALKSKNSFDYADLEGETVGIEVKYTDGTTEKLSVELGFDNSGNVTAKLM